MTNVNTTTQTDYRQLLTRKLTELAKPKTDGIEIERYADEMDNIIANVTREVNVTLVNQETKTIRLIESAFDRLDRGEYGICLRCEGKINERRLRAIAWAQYCVPCQEIQDTIGTHALIAGEDEE